MRKFLILICMCIGIIGVAIADSINLNWYVDGNIYDTSTCTIGDDIILPTTPTKRGYTFLGWVNCTPIEYIESTGTQYIDTGISAPNGYRAHIKFVITEKTNNMIGIIGSHNSSSPWGRNVLFGYNGGLRLGAGGVYAITDLSIINSNVIIELVFSTFVNDIYVTNHNLSNLSNGEDINSTRSSNNLWLFGVCGYSPAEKLKGKIYFVQIWDINNTLVRDFIPVLDSDGVACMYDKVSGTFFYNSGSGNFIAGPVISK